MSSTHFVPDENSEFSSFDDISEELLEKALLKNEEIAAESNVLKVKQSVNISDKAGLPHPEATEIHTINNQQIETLQSSEVPTLQGQSTISNSEGNFTNWIYPINYPERAYQLNIVKKCLFKNTLVCLPTGLGKTFIAAVVMYNFYKWFPSSKLLFLAPSRPLVAQQIEACHKICGISLDDVIEITGKQPPSSREKIWKNKRVFFATPHVVKNDMENEFCKCGTISCVVIDEAHKATGNYPFSLVLKYLAEYNKKIPKCRVLAMSATPASRVDKIQEIIDNCYISHVEVRDETSEDIKPYIFNKEITKLDVELPKEINVIIAQFSSLMLECIDKLRENKALNIKDPAKCSFYTIVLAQKEYLQKHPPNQGRQSGFDNSYSCFAQLLTMKSALDRLIYQSVSQFYSIIYGWTQEAQPDDYSYRAGETSNTQNKILPKYKRDLIKNYRFLNVIKLTKDYINQPEYFSHPKIEVLTKKLFTFFESNKNASCSKVMIFAEYRESVNEIFNAITKRNPLLKPARFFGQSSKKTNKTDQKDQLETMEKFKNNEFNVLVSTCIGEEGLDIGELDLIICYDSHNSPIRMLQRLGRTGRKKEGNIYMLLTKDYEEKKYANSKRSQKSIYSALKNLEKIKLCEIEDDIIPQNVYPECIKKHLEIEKVDNSFWKIKSKSKSPSLLINDLYKGPFLTDSELEKLVEDKDTNKINMSRYKAWQTKYSPIYEIDHSSSTKVLVESMKAIQTLTLKKLKTVSNIQTNPNCKKYKDLKSFGLDSVLKESSLTLDTYNKSINLNTSNNEVLEKSFNSSNNTTTDKILANAIAPEMQNEIEDSSCYWSEEDFFVNIQDKSDKAINSKKRKNSSALLEEDLENISLDLNFDEPEIEKNNALCEETHEDSSSDHFDDENFDFRKEVLKLFHKFNQTKPIRVSNEIQEASQPKNK